MALNNFQERAIFGTLYAGIVIVGILSGPAAFLCIAMIILFACWKEFANIQQISATASWGISSINLFFFGASFAGTELLEQTTIHSITAVLFILLATILLFTTGTNAIKEMSAVFSGTLYLSVPIFLFLLLPQMGNLTPPENLNYWNWQSHLGWPWESINHTPTLIENTPQYHWQYPMLVFILIWSSDTFAYLTGKAIGKHPLHTALSPKKTWEGFAGGTILTALCSAILFHYWNLGPITAGITLGAAFSIFGTAGDLFESALKRVHNIKDSGNFIPGHGGALDRFDAFLFGCVVFWAWLNFLS